MVKSDKNKKGRERISKGDIEHTNKRLLPGSAVRNNDHNMLLEVHDGWMWNEQDLSVGKVILVFSAVRCREFPFQRTLDPVKKLSFNFHKTTGLDRMIILISFQSLFVEEWQDFCKY